MNIFWNSWSEFWTMGGYGFYVWGSVSVFALFMAVEVIALRQRRRAALAAVDAR